MALTELRRSFTHQRIRERGGVGMNDRGRGRRRERAGVNPKLRDRDTDALFQAVLHLRTVDECYRFFEDLCTIGELKALAQRFAVARMLADGRTYEQVAERTGVSSATISRVSRFLTYGADGYALVLDRLRRRGRGAS